MLYSVHGSSAITKSDKYCVLPYFVPIMSCILTYQIREFGWKCAGGTGFTFPPGKNPTPPKLHEKKLYLPKSTGRTLYPSKSAEKTYSPLRGKCHFYQS